MNSEKLILQLVNNEYLHPYFQTEIDVRNFNKFSISEIAMLGAAFSPLANFLTSSNDAFAKALNRFGTDVVYAAEDKVGNPMKLTTSVKGESGKYIGGFVENGKTNQARFRSVSLSEITQNTMEFDPVTMIAAAELMYISKEINTIKQNQENMIKYLLIEKRAIVEGSLSFLTKVLNDFKYNFQNQTYRISMHTKVLDIKQESEQVIIASKNHIEQFLNKNKENYDKLVIELQNYQLSLYLYAFSSFVEIIVLENLNKEYLERVSNRIEEFSIKYRETYTDCYNYIESKEEKNPQMILLQTGAKVSNKMGSIIAKSPIGSKTPIDDKLIRGAETIEKLKDSAIQKRLIDLSNYKNTNTLSFQLLIESINKICNENQLYFDSEYLYIPKTS